MSHSSRILKKLPYLTITSQLRCLVIVFLAMFPSNRVYVPTHFLSAFPNLHDICPYTFPSTQFLNWLISLALIALHLVDRWAIKKITKGSTKSAVSNFNRNQFKSSTRVFSAFLKLLFICSKHFLPISASIFSLHGVLFMGRGSIKNNKNNKPKSH